MSEQRDKEADHVEYLQRYFKRSYEIARPQFERMDNIQMAFDGDIDEDTWATLSEINIPLLRTAVLQVVPFIFNYLTTNARIELVPEDENITFEQISRLESLLQDKIQNKMGVRRNGILTIQDAVKFGCGYGQVKRKIETVPDRQVITVFEGAQAEEMPASMKVGVPKEVLKYEYIPYNCVVPTPDGDSPEDVTCVFHIDFIRQDEFEQMYNADNALPSDQQILKGDPQKIIKDVRENKTDGSVFPLWWIMVNLGNDSNAISRYRSMKEITQVEIDERSPVLIPILKCYFKNEHIWLANGDTIIYQIKDTVQSMSCPIIKASSCIDSGNWWAQSDVSASKDVSDGIINFKNAMMDLISYYLHPTTVYNQQLMGTPNKAPEIGPHQKIATMGDVGNAVSYLSPPIMPQQVFAIGQMLEQDNSTANGQPLNLNGQGVAGLVRGGSGAFESLIANTGIRQEFLGILFEMDWLEPLIYRTLFEMQLLPTDEQSFVKREEKEFVRVTTTADEIRNNFDVRVNLSSKMRSGMNAESMALTRYIQVYKDNPLIDQKAALETVQPDEFLSDRLMATPEQQQATMQRIAQQQQMMQESKAGMTQGEQAVMGGASQRQGMG